LPLMTRETVAALTPAYAAICRIDPRIIASSLVSAKLSNKI
jgi:hypothetical protein